MSVSVEWWCATGGRSVETPAPALVPCRLPCCGQTIQLQAPAVSNYACSSCGEAFPLKRGPACRDYVPTAELTWPGASRTKSESLQRSLTAEDPTVEALVATISSPHAYHLHISGARLQTKHRPGSGQDFLVWRAATAGCTVHAGAVELPERGVLLLAGAGAHFRGTTFTGGVVMCAGADYSGSFESCTFHSTAVYAVHGAAVTLSRCHTVDTHPGLTLSGGATHATMSRCVFNNCHTCVIVDAGAALNARDCSLMFTACAVTVNSPGSHAALRSTDVAGGYDGNIGKTAVAACGGTVDLRECTIATFYTAISARLRTTAIEVHACEVFNFVRGVMCTTRARVLVRDCYIQLSRKDEEAAALLATGDASQGAAGACMQIELTEVHQSVAMTHGPAVAVDKGSAVSAALCRFNGGNTVIVVGDMRDGGGCSAVLAHCTVATPGTSVTVAHPASRLRLRGGSYTGGTTACSVSAGAKLTAVDTEFHSHRVVLAAGVVSVGGGAHAWLRRCDVHTGVVGVCVVGGTVVATDMAVHDIHTLITVSPTAGGCCHEPGAYKGGAGYVCTDGWLTVRGGSVRRCVLGLEADNRETTSGAVTLSGVEFSECGTGADIAHHIAADVSRCSFRGLRREVRGGPALREALRKMFCCSGDAGLSLRTSHAEVQHCTFEGFSSGIMPQSEHEASVRDCTVTVTKHGGACVLAHGKIALEDCAFSGKPGRGGDEFQTFGVHAVDGAACAIRRCTFTGLSGDAVEAEGLCSVTIVDSTVAGGSSRGLVVTGAAELAAQDCRIEGVHTAVGVNLCGGKFTAKRVTMRSSYINVHLPSVREQDTRRTVVKLVDSVLTGSVTSVCICDAFAELAFIRCRISDCDTGIVLGGPQNARMKGTVISRCKTGVSVGDVMRVEPDACPVCGDFGDSAYRGAYASLFRRGGRPAPEGRCAHEGAIARLSMEDSELVDCRQLGVRVNLHGRVDAAGVTARRCRTAFFMEYLYDRSKFVQCKAVGCAIPTQGAQHRQVGARPLPVVVPMPEVEVLPGEGG